MPIQKIKKLANILLSFRSQKELENFLIGLLTPQEIEQFDKRLDIIEYLKNDLPQRQIAEKMKVGIATVTRGSKMLKKGHFKNV
jgi:TrpR family trp operon transcriptional repressor